MNNERPISGCEKHVKCIFIKGIIVYIEKTYGEDVLLGFSHRVGIPLKFLRNEENWITWDEYERVIAEVSRYDNNIFNEIAKTTLQKENLGGLWFVVFAHVANFSTSLRKAIKYMSLFNLSSDWEILKLEKNEITLKINWKPGIRVTKESCRHRQEIIKYATTLWGNPPAICHTIQCQLEGHNSCIEKYQWVNRFKKIFTLLLPSLAFIIIIILQFNTEISLSSSGGIVVIATLAGYILDCNGKTVSDHSVCQLQSIELSDAMLKLEEKYDELQKSHEELNSAYEELFEITKHEPLREIAGGLSHDYNNILTGIMGHIDLAIIELYNDSSKNDIAKHLEAINGAATIAQSLTNQLLLFSRDGTPLTQATSINNLLFESIEFALSGTNIKTHFKIDDELDNVTINPGQLGQVISNITINAAQSMPEGGNYYITAHNKVLDSQNSLLHDGMRPGRYLQISFRDEGIGISEENINKIFDLYYTTKTNGHGIGLASSFHIIRKHNGWMEAHSKIGTGTTLDIYLPASQHATIEETEAILRPVFYHGNILAVESEPMLRNLLEKAVSYLGYTITIAKDTHELLTLYQKEDIEENPFDLVLLEITEVDDISGYKILKDLLKINPKVKVIAIGSYHQGLIIGNHKEYGIYATLKKPYSLSDLSNKLYDAITQE